jgi:hypothetical protein
MPTCNHAPFSPAEGRSTSAIPCAAPRRGLAESKQKGRGKAEKKVAPAESRIVNDFSGDKGVIEPNQLRWKPFAMPSDKDKVDFVQVGCPVRPSQRIAMLTCVVHRASRRWQVPAAWRPRGALQLCLLNTIHHDVPHSGLAIHIYTCNESMGDKAMCNSDGDLLFGASFASNCSNLMFAG